MGWGLLFLLVALEEISWGQRIFGVETPDFLTSRNLQKETNLHNLESEGANRLLGFLVFAVGVALPSLLTLSGWLNSLVKRFGVPLPQIDLWVPVRAVIRLCGPSVVHSGP